jgi:DNA-binding response OmpR family regulator
MMSQLAILLVESDLAMCDAFAAFAQAYGHGFCRYATLDEAIGHAAPGPHDVVIADTNQADEVRRLVAWLGALAVKPRAVVLTSRAPDMVRRLLGPGSPVAVMRKPIDMDELRAVMK